jgi:hypothetical protein
MTTRVVGTRTFVAASVPFVDSGRCASEVVARPHPVRVAFWDHARSVPC